jgi:hypothetical protein
MEVSGCGTQPLESGLIFQLLMCHSVVLTKLPRVMLHANTFTDLLEQVVSCYGVQAAILAGHTDQVCGVAFSPDGAILASLGR